MSIDRFDLLALIGLVAIVAAIFVTWGVTPTLAFVGMVCLVVGLAGAWSRGHRT